MTITHVTALVIYPVKSLSGMSLTEARLTPSGLAGDRQWAIINSQGRPLTQRQNPRMALIQPLLDNHGLTLSAVGHGEVDILSPQENNLTPIHVWKDTCHGWPANEEANRWIEGVLEEPPGSLNLVNIDASRARSFANTERFNLPNSAYFSDAAPYLITNQSSLATLNKRCIDENLHEVDMRHFRANIVLEGLDAFSEHQYTQLTRGDRPLLQLIDHCQRCIMITVDPDKGSYLPQNHPFKTLAKLNGMPEQPKAPAFGVNATLAPQEASATLQIGDTLVAK